MKLETQITFTPYTIDTYQTFDYDYAEDSILEDYPEGITYDDLDWTYDNAGYVQALADNWLGLMQDNILDSVIKGVELDGKAYSPREYNFTTDNCQVVFEIDIDKLQSYIKEHQKDYNENRIRSESGFIWLGTDNDAMLHYYLHDKTLSDYPDRCYLDDQISGVCADNYITVKEITKE